MKSTVIQPSPGQAVLSTSDTDEQDCNYRGRSYERPTPSVVVVNDRYGSQSHNDGDSWESTILGNLSDGFRAVQSDLNTDSTSLHNNLSNGFRAVQSDLSTGFRDSVRDTKDAEANIRGAVRDSEANVRSDVCSAEADLKLEIKDSEADIRHDVKNAECNIRDNVKDSTLHLSGSIKDTQSVLNKNLFDGFLTTVRDIKDTRFDIIRDIGDRLDGGFSDTQASFSSLKDRICDLGKDQALGFKEQLSTQYQIEGRNLLNTEKHTAFLSLQNEKLGAAQTLLSHQLAAAAAATAERHFAETARRAEQIACETQRQLAECCCELKEKITAEGVSTRGLLEANEKERLRDALRKAETSLATYFCRGVPPVIPACA